MVDKDLYIQQLTYELRKTKARNTELFAENAQLILKNGLLEKRQIKTICLDCRFCIEYDNKFICQEYNQVVKSSDYCAWGIKKKS